MSAARRTRSQARARSRVRQNNSWARKWGATREERARNMLNAGKIPHREGDALIVPSQTVDGAFYTLYLNARGKPISCGHFARNGQADEDDGCKDFEWRCYEQKNERGQDMRCKHIILATMWSDQQSAVQAATQRRQAVARQALANRARRRAQRRAAAESDAAPAREPVRAPVRRSTRLAANRSPEPPAPAPVARRARAIVVLPVRRSRRLAAAHVPARRRQPSRAVKRRS